MVASPQFTAGGVWSLLSEIEMKAITYLLAAIIMLTAGCGKSDKGEDTSDQSSKHENSNNQKIVARVNSKPIYETQLRDKRLNDIIADEILYDDALRQGLDKDKTIENRLLGMKGIYM